MGTLRVIAGKAKGLRLRTVPGDTTRPITDIVKEALFNILGDEIDDNQILDLFGGTGAVGIEALSRGARFVTFLDKGQQAVRTMQQNLETTKFADQAEVIRTDAFTYLSNPLKENFDLIYVAPPQYKQMWQKAVRLIDAKPELLSENGQIIVQINPIEWEELILENFEVFDSRKYGDTLLVFFEKNQ
ncbi:MAG: 16S rRNA (guanine(966)-N(2))-methyltransferase RsmD [Anaerolineaceae bacterium]|jgi:16S rRNA (guanine(966)-N(2))-methyltransferase RsmD|nr:16S rRNA (guanine(966)-N(2))-methyltransferase RsmD [Anaerolineaceae bacterium]MDD4043347.1 16S rRNA (guanine(966)-N(2))-methyltransferase RsmD [Anaerolineaceae bacterium]MDD4578167.1 16S rRNA (guanine(966)-N(2))-methyltransferase RsmD [Anaerolineaceae bacterium]